MGGQCLPEVRKLAKKAGTWTKKAQRVFDVWGKYHLNGMHAGLPVQMRALEGMEQHWSKEATPEQRYYDGSVNFHALPGGYYEQAVTWLKERGLYEVPLPEGATCAGSFPEDVTNGTRGYRYGERCVYSPIPAEIVEEIKTW